MKEVVKRPDLAAAYGGDADGLRHRPAKPGGEVRTRSRSSSSGFTSSSLHVITFDKRLDKQ